MTISLIIFCFLVSRWNDSLGSCWRRYSSQITSRIFSEISSNESWFHSKNFR